MEIPLADYLGGGRNETAERTRLINGIYKENATGEPRIYPYYFDACPISEARTSGTSASLLRLLSPFVREGGGSIARFPPARERNYPGYRRDSSSTWMERNRPLVLCANEIHNYSECAVRFWDKVGKLDERRW